MEPSQNDSKFEEHLSLVPLFSNGYSDIQIFKYMKEKETQRRKKKKKKKEKKKKRQKRRRLRWSGVYEYRNVAERGVSLYCQKGRCLCLLESPCVSFFFFRAGSLGKRKKD
jgi:hypothetical protein